MISQLQNFDISFSKEEKVVLLLPSQHHLKQTLVYGKDKLIFEEISKILLSYSKNTTKDNDSQALVMKNKGKVKTEDGRTKQISPEEGRSQKEENNYFHCGKPGHIKRKCRVWKRIQEEGQIKDDNTTTARASKENEDVAMVANEYLHGDNMVEWVVNTSIFYHVTPHKELFFTYKVGDSGTVKIGITTCSNTVRIGDICIKTNIGSQLTSKDARHVPDLRLNLMSVNAFDKEGFHDHFGNGKWKLSKGFLIIARGKSCCTQYKTYGMVCEIGLNVTANASPSLWHKKTGHMNEKGLQILKRRNLFPL